MVDEKIEKILKEFLGQWNKYLLINPSIILDETWPSLTVIDLLTFSTRYRAEVPKQLDPMMKGSSVYLAKMLGNCWSDSVETVKITDSENGVIVEASGGELIPQGEKIVLPIEKVFRQALGNLPNPFPVTRNFSCDIKFESNVVSMFALGLFTGLAEGIEGSWATLSEKQLAPLIDSVVKELSRQTVFHYSKLYPNEPLGQMAELYLNDLIYPPMMMKESLPLLSSIPKLLKYFETCSIQKDAALALGQNLALSPDHLLSNVGLVLCCALSEKIPAAPILAAAHRKGSYVGFLRRAMKEVRAFYGDDEDWVETGLRNDKALRQFAIEQSMMFLPWITISKDRLKKDAGLGLLNPLLIKACDFDLDAGIEVANQISKELPGDIEVHLQKIRFEMIKGDFEKADSMFRKLLDEPEADSSPDFYYWWGTNALRHGGAEKALSYFKAGLALKIEENVLYSNLSNSAAWACMLTQQHVPALTYLDQALAKSIYPVTILLNKASVFWDLGQEAEAKEVRKLLFRLAPCDRRVFSTIALEESTAG